MASLAKGFYWCSIVITVFCEIAAITIFAAIATAKLPGQYENWMAVLFFALAGGVSWIAGHAARSISG